jgi:hypothetical protein
MQVSPVEADARQDDTETVTDDLNPVVRVTAKSW